MSHVTNWMSVEGLRKEAKRWLRAVRAGDTVALQRIERVIGAAAVRNLPGLRTVQHALARERGYESWAALKEHIELVSLADRGRAALVDEFLRHACIFSGGPLDFPEKWRRASRIHKHAPDIAGHSLHAAVVCGELEAVRAFLREDSKLVEEKAGPQAWEPLLYLCYGRLPEAKAATNAVAIAELLLDAGADPNVMFVHSDGDFRFSALCGVMGKGEMGGPEHPRAKELAELLLRRGANPNESQGLYNTHLAYVGDDTSWLELLFRHGLDNRAPIDWHATKPAEPPSTLVDFLLAQAATNGHLERVRCLLDHGASPNAPSIYNRRSSYENALMAGRRDIAELLVARGATRVLPRGRTAFVAACALGDRAEAKRLLSEDPSFLEVVEPLIDASRRGQREVVELLLDLGMDPNRYGRHGHLALHEAVENVAMCELLLARGADPRRRAFGGTPQSWARRAGNLDMARWHAEQSRLLLDAVASGHVALARELTREDPSCVRERSPTGATVLHVLPSDPEQAEALIELLVPLGADPSALDDEGRTPAEVLVADGLDEIADLLAER